MVEHIWPETLIGWVALVVTSILIIQAALSYLSKRRQDLAERQRFLRKHGLPQPPADGVPVITGHMWQVGWNTVEIPAASAAHPQHGPPQAREEEDDADRVAEHVAELAEWDRQLEDGRRGREAR